MKYILSSLVIIIAFVIGCRINPKQSAPFVLAAIVAVAGWFIGHSLSVERDRANKQRDLRIEYLIDAYRRLANASWRPPEPGSQYFRDMESAIADIQLFGTESQIGQAKNFMSEFQKTGRGPLDKLLNNLRNDLRKEMNLPEIKANVQWFRPEGAPTLESKKQNNEEK